jgi:hypothetical protein
VREWLPTIADRIANRRSHYRDVFLCIKSCKPLLYSAPYVKATAVALGILVPAVLRFDSVDIVSRIAVLVAKLSIIGVVL